MKKYLITVSTNWCGMDQTYRAETENKLELEEIAMQAAIDNFNDYDCWEYVAEELGYTIDRMLEDDWNDVYNSIDESAYCDFKIEEFKGDEEEWNTYPNII